MATDATTTTIAPAQSLAGQESESHWTPQVIIGGALSFIMLGGLLYELFSTQSESIHSQIVSILSMGFGSAVTFFLGNMQRPRANSGGTQALINAEPPSVVTVNNPPGPRVTAHDSNMVTP